MHADGRTGLFEYALCENANTSRNINSNVYLDVLENYAFPQLKDCAQMTIQQYTAHKHSLCHLGVTEHSSFRASR
jgi:hypothetical protein